MIYYVSCRAIGYGDGTVERPFRRIQQAAEVAMPGDEVVVAPGLYREYVNPRNSGQQNRPVVYRAEMPGESIISGSEQVQCWRQHTGDVWVARIHNGIFNDYNPYTTVIGGDWYYSDETLHTGEVYLNGKSMYEAGALEDVIQPVPHLHSEDREFSVYRWYTAQEDAFTLIYANFHGENPNEQNVEINVRRNCFYPDRPGVDYITVSGFTVKQAATTWAPPTAYQEGMIGPHWSKGWIIEDCEISDSKCVGICLGKYLQPENENKWTRQRMKHGTQTERDAICQAQLEGWSKETVGSHIIRRCHVHHCEQAGIVGHLGCIFSVIEDNHIHHINTKHQLFGAEVAGIKLHAAIDTQLRRNHIHHCTRGIWLDWQAQGTAISSNFLHHNFPGLDREAFQAPFDIGEDLFIEVSHGPTLVDHNILMSPQAVRLSTQGTAFVHNLICGSFTSVGTGTNNVGGVETNAASSSGSIVDASARYTPYHVPHGTAVAGFMTFLHGDCRLYNNIFVQKEAPGKYDALFQLAGTDPQNSVVGTEPFSDFPTGEEYRAMFCGEGDRGISEDRSKYYRKLPVALGGNLFFNGARPSAKEIDFVADDKNRVSLQLVEGEENCWLLKTDIAAYIPTFETPFVSTELLGEAFEPEQKFENPDGSPILFHSDYFGFHRGINPTPGPFETPAGWKLISERIR